ncbi:MAG: hypothetical protein CM15mP40_09320 [Alphaproteobacteria bacterium]|nr:MAG: hypothetical protein CM15mP40_09320 [Alphaproteobacteria bacterium]
MRIFRGGFNKKLEELGIGRPSTYVSIFTKLESNNYISIKNKSLIPSSRGKILSKFLDGLIFLNLSIINLQPILKNNSMRLLNLKRLEKYTSSVSKTFKLCCR